VDGASVAPPKTIRIAPGVHTLDRGPGATPRIVRRAFDAGESVTLDVVAARPARASDAPPPERAPRPPIAAFAAFAVALVAGGAAVYFGVQVKGAQDDFDRTPTPGTRDGFYRARTATNVSAAIAVAAAAVGVVAWTVKF
jgi:hypothetical protein